MSAPTAPLARAGWFPRSRAADGGPIPVSTQAPQGWLVIGSGMAILALGAVIVTGQGAQQAALYTIGLALGLALYHARFGFTSAWRQLAAVGQGAGLRAHALMLGAACVLFAPVLAGGAGLFGVEPAGNVSPLGLSLLVGAVLFGVGMQLGGACASGTLFAIGGGHSAIVVTLVTFVAGSVLGAWHWDFWVNGLPALPAVSLAASRLGYPGALAVSLTVLGGVAWATVAVGRRRNPPPVDRPAAAPGLWRIVGGSQVAAGRVRGRRLADPGARSVRGRASIHRYWPPNAVLSDHFEPSGLGQSPQRRRREVGAMLVDHVPDGGVLEHVGAIGDLDVAGRGAVARLQRHPDVAQQRRRVGDVLQDVLAGDEVCADTAVLGERCRLDPHPRMRGRRSGSWLGSNPVPLLPPSSHRRPRNSALPDPTSTTRLSRRS